MDTRNLYKDIAARTNGDIYIGVVGPVRTGKSTFIKRFMETLVIPNMKGDFRRERAIDELPQSGSGRTIMTTEPKFIPEEAVEMRLGDNIVMRTRMIDCVGYIVPSSLGYIENEAPRMVVTPWFDREIPFNMAAEIGTRKVITEHSTIGLVVTTDGSISDIPRDEYEEAEERVISELKEINKPFIVLVNSVAPQSEGVKDLSQQLEGRYAVPVIPVNCMEMGEDDIKNILTNVLGEFPVKEIAVDMPMWVTSLDKNHWLKSAVYTSIMSAAQEIRHIREIKTAADAISGCEYVNDAHVAWMDMGTGRSRMAIRFPQELFYKILSETTGLDISDESQLVSCVTDLSSVKRQYDKVNAALMEVEATGYGIVMPSIDDLRLEEPEIIKQGGKYGVRLRASAPSIHMMKAVIETEVCPIVGSEKQSEDLVMYLMKEFEENPTKIWESNIFGKSLNDLVNEGLHSKLLHMPADARMKIQETMERIINEGCTGLICIII